MDYKDILAVVLLIVVIVIGGKLFPNNPLNILNNYIKNLFVRKS